MASGPSVPSTEALQTLLGRDLQDHEHVEVALGDSFVKGSRRDVYTVMRCKKICNFGSF